MRSKNFTPGPWKVAYDGPGLITVQTVEKQKNCILAEMDSDTREDKGNFSLMAAAPEMREAGGELNALIVKAQQFLARYIVPDSGISDTEAVNELLGIFDGSEQREAQAKWITALAKADGGGAA